MPLNAEKYGGGLRGLLRQGFAEIPAVMIGNVYWMIGCAMMVYTMHRVSKYGDDRMYRQEYTVYRPDDPRAEHAKLLQERARTRPHTLD